MSKNWLEAVSEDELFEAIDAVSRRQRNHDVFSGSKSENCDRCKFVTRDSSYPDGSPTGLICTQKSVAVTASAACDAFRR